MQPKAIALRSRTSPDAPFPVICAPLVGRTPAQLLAEAAAAASKQADLLEWRVDFFEGIADNGQVVDVAGQIRRASGGIPLLFTRRSSREGGEKISISEEQVVALYRAVSASGHADLIDFEMGNDASHLRAVREFSRADGVQLILSFHDFARTPDLEALKQRFAQAQALGADVSKIAVMPAGMEDVLTLLAATRHASETLAIPVVSMSMGPLGAVTRLCGWTFGSAMTFAVTGGSSAPGQMAIEEVRAGVAMLRKASGPRAS